MPTLRCAIARRRCCVSGAGGGRGDARRIEPRDARVPLLLRATAAVRVRSRSGSPAALTHHRHPHTPRAHRLMDASVHTHAHTHAPHTRSRTHARTHAPTRTRRHVVARHRRCSRPQSAAATAERVRVRRMAQDAARPVAPARCMGRMRCAARPADRFEPSQSAHRPAAARPPAARRVDLCCLLRAVCYLSSRCIVRRLCGTPAAPVRRADRPHSVAAPAPAHPASDRRIWRRPPLTGALRRRARQAAERWRAYQSRHDVDEPWPALLGPRPDGWLHAGQH